MCCKTIVSTWEVCLYSDLIIFFCFSLGFFFLVSFSSVLTKSSGKVKNQKKVQGSPLFAQLVVVSVKVTESGHSVVMTGRMG